jgi:hypothetical protein
MSDSGRPRRRSAASQAVPSVSDSEDDCGNNVGAGPGAARATTAAPKRVRRSYVEEEEAEHDQGNGDGAERPVQADIFESVNEHARFPVDFQDARFDIKVTAAEQKKWDAVPVGTRDQITASVVRLLVFKGGNSETVTREMVRDVLEGLNEESKKHVSVALAEARTKLADVFGLSLCLPITSLPDHVGTVAETDGDDPAATATAPVDRKFGLIMPGNRRSDTSSSTTRYYIVNSLVARNNAMITPAPVEQESEEPPAAARGRSSRSASASSSTGRNSMGGNGNQVVARLGGNMTFSVLSELASSTDRAYFGFAFVVFHILWSYDRRSATEPDILRKLRKLEARFPDTITLGSGASSGTRGNVAVPALGDDFMGLLGRMLKGGYIAAVKNDAGEDLDREGATLGNAKKERKATLYTFGDRFYLEFGVEKLVKSYFYALSDETVGSTNTVALSVPLQVEMKEHFKELQMEYRPR